MENISNVDFAFAPSPLGELLVAANPRGLCALYFADDRERALAAVRKLFPCAEFTERSTPLIEKALAAVTADTDADLPLHLVGTPFQVAVWLTLTEISRGQTTSYGEIARRVGRPKAVRAVGSAVGANPVSVVVPCHRVIRSDGGIGGYAGGLDRKRKLLKAEGIAI